MVKILTTHRFYNPNTSSSDIHRGSSNIFCFNVCFCLLIGYLQSYLFVINGLHFFLLNYVHSILFASCTCMLSVIQQRCVCSLWLCKCWSFKVNKEKHLCYLLLKLGEPLQRSSRLQEVVGALEGKECEEHEECDDREKMEDASIETNIDDADYTLGAMLLT